MRRLPSNGWVCHHSNACNGSAGVLCLLFTLTLDLLLLPGVLEVFLHRLLPFILGAHHCASKLSKSMSWQKQIETKTRRKHDIQTSEAPGDYILRSFISKGTYWEKTSRRQSPGWPHHLVAWPGVGPRHGVVWATPAPFSSPFRFVTFLID